MNLLEGNVFKTLVKFSLPFMLSTILQTLYSTVDMMIVGNVTGKAGLSALSTGSQLMEMIIVFCVGFSSAGQVLISQFTGAGERKKAETAANTLLVLMLIIAFSLTIIGISGCDLFLHWLNAPAEAFSHAHNYVTVCCGGIIFTSLYNMFSAVFRGIGDSKHPLYFIAIASAVNIVLDLIFVAVLGMGAAGAALATVIGQAISVICCIMLFLRHPEQYLFSFSRDSFRFDRELAVKITGLGIPMTLQSSAIYISFLFVNGMINSMGVVVSAAFGASSKIRNLPNMITQAIGMGATAMVGQNIGAGKMDRVSKIFTSSMIICIIANTLFAIPCLLMPEGMFRMFTQDPDVLAFSGMCIFCILIELPAKFFMAGGNAIVSGSGFVRLAMVLAFTDAFVGRIFLTWFLGSFLGIGTFGFFLGYGLGTYLTAIPLLIYYLSGKWRFREKLV